MGQSYRAIKPVILPYPAVDCKGRGKEGSDTFSCPGGGHRLLSAGRLDMVRTRTRGLSQFSRRGRLDYENQRISRENGTVPLVRWERYEET